MRIGSYILVAILALFSGLGSGSPAWLCVRADGAVRLKASGGAPCESACFGESDSHDEDASIALSAPDDCCLDIPLGFDAGAQPGKPTRSRRADSSPTPLQIAALDTPSLPTGGDLALLTPSHPPGSYPPSAMVRTVVLLI